MEMRDITKVCQEGEKKIKEENCVEDPSNAKAEGNTIPENNDNTLYYITEYRVEKAHFDSTSATTKDEVEAGLLNLLAAIVNKNSQLMRGKNKL